MSKRTPPVRSRGQRRSAGLTSAPRPPRWKLWCFRLAGALLVPLALLGSIEVGLRLGGAGYSTSFLLPFTKEGRAYWVQNNRFGWRFFGPRMARAPHPLFVPQQKPLGTLRIFVFGESAAYGDPLPAFGLPRMLQALLELRYPGAKFEIINAAMTGINSHAVLPIARDCASAGGDIWIVYMGNNEVVGPFGPGTVFGPQTPPLPLIRASLWFRTLRLGQLLESGLGREGPDEEWGGMSMFVKNQVTASDPRLRAVYGNFTRNLQDLIRAGRRHGAGVVVSTMGANLRDCPPFASSHRAGLDGAEAGEWEQYWKRGLEARGTGNHAEALTTFRAAARLDETFAALRFAIGDEDRALRQFAAARQEYEAARDLDALRFRCDSRMNALIRETAAKWTDGRVLLADAEEGLRKRSDNGVPGGELFYDHVHFTFDGTYTVALAIAEQIDKLLPASITGQSADRHWPTVEACAQRLAWSDFGLRAALLEMVPRLSDPPFVGQLDHAARLQQLQRSIEELSPAVMPAGIAAALRGCESTLASHPDDDDVWIQSALLAEAAGETNKAVSAARRAVDLSPASVEAWGRLGSALEKQNQLEQAALAFRQVIVLDSQAFAAMNSLGRVLAKLGRGEEAVAVYREAVALKPRFGPAWLSLGELLERSGQPEEAGKCYQKALANRVRMPSELSRLAMFCRDRGWQLAAATNFADAVSLNPSDVPSRLHAGQAYAAAGLPAEAERQLAEAARLAPDYAPARFLYGQALGRAGHPAEAEQQFRAAARLMPDLPEARLNLAVSLASQGRSADAIAEYETVLARWPTNEVARRNLDQLRSGASTGAAH